jgi:hypothetical protein
MIAVIPFTLLVIFPTNKKLLDPSLDKSSELASKRLARWARLRSVRSVRGLISHLAEENYLAGPKGPKGR